MTVILANAAMSARSPYLNNTFESFRKLHAWSTSSTGGTCSGSQQSLSRNALGVKRIAARKALPKGELGCSINGAEEKKKVGFRVRALSLLGDEEAEHAETRGIHFEANSRPPGELKSAWIRPAKAESGRKTKWTPPESNYSRQNVREASFGTNRGRVRDEDSHGLRLGLGFRGDAESNIVGEQKRAAFEIWARQKLREAGNSSLSAIEEMRQTFAQGSPILDPSRIGVSSAVETRRNVGLERNPKYNQAVARRSFPPSPIGDVRKAGIASHAGGVYRTSSSRFEHRGLSPSTSRFGAGRSSEQQQRFSTMSAPWSPKSRAPNRKRSVQFSAEESGKAGGGESSSNADRSDAPSTPQPQLVKRKTKLPINWHGPGGTVMLVDKPQGWSSFAVCSKLRHLLNIQKVGHAGTLDPMATGLLIICLGKATKLADSYQAMTKVYSGTIRLGERTPSLDKDTEVSDVLPWEHITDEQLEQAKQDFIGDIFQTPPMYSAIKVDGERLYMKARRGEQIEVQPRLVTVNDFTLERSPENRQDVDFKVTCSKGTYVRSLCADLGQAVGSYAHLTALRREKIGAYSVKDAWPILDFVEQYTQTSESVAIKAKA